MDEDGLYRLAIERWGVQAQKFIIVEELGELIQVVAKLGRNINGVTESDVVTEIADVEIMLKQLKILLNINDMDVKVEKNAKLTRLAKMLGVEYNAKKTPR